MRIELRIQRDGQKTVRPTDISLLAFCETQKDFLWPKLMAILKISLKKNSKF